MRGRLINSGPSRPFAPPPGRGDVRPACAGEAVRPLTAALLAALLVLSLPARAPAQSGGHILYGDFKVDESKVEGLKPISFDIILYSLGGAVLARQTVASNGRYRFMNLGDGDYDLAVEVENREVARVRVSVQSRFKTDFRHDLSLEWRAAGAERRERAQTVSAADFYKRAPANRSLFEKAQEAFDKKKYDQAASLLRQLLDADAKDFQAWTELGTVYLMQDKSGEAEAAYRRATEERPTFALALLNLGRLRVAQKKFEAAIEPLTRAVAVQPASAEANFLLGESYLQTRKGSKAVGYLNEAARLGRTEAHLRLATLYNAA